MRFMQFRADDQFSLQISKRERIEVKKGSQIPYLFRLPFAGGNVFSAEMLDTLLYQTFLKNYLISFVRLLLRIDQADDSGYLGCREMKGIEVWIKTYGRLYQFLASAEYEIPIAIYRTDQVDTKRNDKRSKNSLESQKSIENIIKSRTFNLGHTVNNDQNNEEEKNFFSYVIINPSYDLELRQHDIILVIQTNKLKYEQSNNIS
jgi:potassium channel subfamily T member 1